MVKLFWKLTFFCGFLSNLRGVQSSEEVNAEISYFPHISDFTVHTCPVGSDFTYACPSTKEFGVNLVCIHESWLCDGDPDCPLGEDEGTLPGQPCHNVQSDLCIEEDQFQCADDASVCIPKNWMCDGDLDCDDGSDEAKVNCIKMGVNRSGPHVQNLIPCTPNQLQCGGSHKCIPLSKVCDKSYDCDNGEDESGCSSTNCENKKCAKCAELSVEGAKCYCDEGFHWNETSQQCVDLDECEYEQFCDQPSVCENTNGSYTCACVPGYKLNNSTCTAINVPEGEKPTLLISNEWDLRQLTITGKSLSPAYVKITQRTSTLAFDHRKQQVCWITYSGNEGKSYLQCSSTTSASAETQPVQINAYLASVQSFAKDWVLGNWYFVDPKLKQVFVCSENGRYCRVLFDKSLSEPTSIVLDPRNGYMYFSDWKKMAESVIYRATLSGEQLTPLVATKLVFPQGLAIDFANNHLYWSDAGLNVVERIDLLGENGTRRVIAIGEKVKNIESIAVFENYLFLSDHHENQLFRIHRNLYAHPMEILANLSRPGQVHVYHRQMQPDVSSVDASTCTSCGHLCVETVVDEKVTTKCLCSAGYKGSNGACAVNEDCREFCNGTTYCSGPTDTHYPPECSLALCPPDKSYCSASKTCLPTTWWCDKKIDCPNGDDENLYCMFDECAVFQFLCASGRCIDQSSVCDGNPDCGPYDKSDEFNCNVTCNPENMFQCTEDKECIMKIFVCDGHNDCLDGSDEAPEICGSRTELFPCNSDIEFHCRNGECIANSWKCDGDPDCADGSDEDKDICGGQQMQCKDKERVCDSQDRCIPEIWFCDGEPDCLDRSDESDAHCPDANYTCAYPSRKCEKNATHVCVKPEQLCDGINHCDDAHFDEGGECNNKMCDQESHPCSDLCYNTPEAPGFICACNVGEKLNTDNHTCIPAVPVDKLCEQWGICGQACMLDSNVTHGYRCTCLDGFFLEPDGFTCKPLESDPVYVIFSNRHELRQVDVATSNAISLISGLRNTIALDFYYKNGVPVLFWTDVMEDKIYRGTMAGNNLINVEAIIKSGLATTEGVAIDWVGENIYWVESSLDQIEVAKLDGTNRTTLIAGEMTSPRAIVVDPREGALFWTDWDGHNPRIEKCSMSGEGRSVIHKIIPAEGGGWPNGLTVDYDFKRLYWIDARSESIHSVDYYGGDHRLILKGHTDMTHPFAMSLFGNHVYWTDWSTNSVVRANKFNGSDVQIVQKTITQPFDLQVVHPKRQPLMDNPCAVNNGGCSDLCLINYNRTVGCRCPHRKKLGSDNKKCVDDIKFLLFIKNHEIRGVDIEKAHFNVIPVITIPHVDTPTAIDYDIKTDTLYWADKGLNMINRANFTAGVETLIDKGLSNPEGFAIDWLSSNMYFSSYNVNAKTASISVATLSGSFRTEIINKDIVMPQSIALHPPKGLLYFTDVNGADGNHTLYRAKMDGSEFMPLLKGLTRPSSLSVDVEGDMVYFINSGNDSIMSCDLNGNSVTTITHANISKPKALTVYKNYLYVSTNELIVSITKDGGSFTVLRDTTPNVNALLMYDTSTRQKASNNDCHKPKSNCSQLCLPKGAELSGCKCTAGFDLAEDNESCVGIKSFLLYAKETEIRGQKFEPLSTQEALPPISQIQSASAVDFLASEDTIFWVDTKANTISRIKRDLTSREVIVRDGISSVEGLAVDWIAKTIYWTDAGHSTIEMAKIDGTNRYVITSGDMEKPRSIVVNPFLGYLYWSDWGMDARIERTRLDGSERVHYVFTDITMPWGLTIDYDSQNLFWCDTDSEKQLIEAIDLLKDKRRILIKRDPGFAMSPISLTVFDNSIYWIDGNLNKTSIYRTSSVDGADRTLIRADLGSNLKDIKAYDSSRQTGTNPCATDNGGCSELCFYIGNGGVKCGCSFGKLAADGKSCEPYSGFLMFSKVTGMESINLNNSENQNPPIPPIRSDTYLRNVIGLSFDYKRKMIFYSDIQRGDIQAVFFNGTNITVVVEGIGSAEGLAYERVNDDLYWTSYTNSCISKINVNDALKNKTKKPEVVIQMSKMDHPRAIVVDSCWELIYWTNWNNMKPRIQRSNLTGEQAEDIIVKDILTPNGLTIDHKGKKLYWSDARLDKIERCDMDGSNRYVIITSIPQHSFGLVIYDDYLFWTDWMLRAVIRANKYDGTGITWLRKNLERQPMGIIAVAEDSEDCSINMCHGDNNGCQDECYTDEKGQAFCQCRYGRLTADGKTCASDYSCKNLDYEAFPCLSGFCLPFQKSCDGVLDCIDGSDEFQDICKDRDCPPTMLPCANRTQGQCVALSKKCNGMVDCRDESDELGCGCKKDEFQCKNGKCILNELRCDGNMDCHDGSDEVGCDDVKCALGQWKCKTGKTCIPEDRKCDRHFDCGDKSDEDQDMCSGKLASCGTDMFTCENGECIKKEWQCDRDHDCVDGSDEVNCTYSCKEGQFMCTNDTKCVSNTWVCDGNDDCQDGSDENNCTCTADQFKCTSGRCIDKAWVCDQEPDCQDGRDESPEAGCEPIECDEDEFQCANYRCVEQEFYCDNDDDCGDNSDEPDTCDYSRFCSEDEFSCSDGDCIDKSKRCDGASDCPDGSDEKMCPNKGPCGNETQFQCENNVCISQDLVCNGRNDCGDGSDESPRCNFDECKLQQPCSQICEGKKIGYTCKCHPGYKLRPDNRTCEDVDECQTVYPCSQICKNTVGSYYCDCAAHYRLDADKRHCSLVSGEDIPYLLVSNRYYIKRVDFNSSGNTSVNILVKNLTHSVAIDFDFKEQKLYWTDIHSQSSTINRISLNPADDEKPQVLHSSTVLNPDGMAVDWIGRNLYWCDRNTDTIEVSRLDGRYRKILLKDKAFLQEPRALELFPKYGYMFLSDWGDSPHISRLSMDGKMKMHIITDEIAWPNALTIDYVTEKLFWADANYDYIAMADLDGTNRHVVISENLPHTFALTTFLDSIYWTDWETNGIFQAEKFTGEKRTQLARMVHRPMDLVVYHGLRQPEWVNNPCPSLNCSHLCLLQQQGNKQEATAVCACPENHNLNDDKRTCTAACDKAQILCESSSRCIPMWWKCDGHADCEDGSDEPPECKNVSYPCNQPGLFKCHNAVNASDCIPPVGICDNIPQCSDGSDETSWNNCTDYPCIMHQFKCEADSKCISDIKVCDGHKDCSDGADEKDCAKQECLDTQFRCNGTGNCIPYLWQCDGDNDCGDWFDEQSCTNRVCKENYIKCNNTKKCIPQAWECDGEYDCGPGDETDENQETCSQKTCDPTYFKCQNAHCIPGRWRCDDDQDCSDGSDEKDCPPRNCTTGIEFKCHDGSKCIPQSLLCDGRPDCKDKSDEMDCQSVIQCSSTEFQCPGSLCIPSSWKCDGESDCFDGSDEQNCSAGCSNGEFRCKNGSCISLLWRCDGESDCSDGSDEIGCSSFACAIGRFRCGDHKCIPLHKKCNGVKDCADGLDEEICVISKCPYGQYRCNNGRKCLKPTQLCDGTKDCQDDGDDDDGEDEGQEICKAESQLSCGPVNGGCSKNCSYLSTLHLTKCFCPPGFVLADDDRTCIEKNPCDDWGTCSQLCLHIPGNQTECKCEVPYYKHDNSTNLCVPQGTVPVLMIVDEDRVYKQHVTDVYVDPVKRSISGNATKIVSLDVDTSSPEFENWKMFLMKQKSGPGKSIVLKLFVEENDKKDSEKPARNTRETTLADKEEILISGLNDPMGLAVDWIGKTLYWTDSSTAKIEMCRYNYTSCIRRKTVVKDNLSQPFSIAVDPNVGKLFWTDRGYPPKIESANLDGSNRTILVQNFLIWPNGLAIDYPNQRLYWADTKSHVVETVDFNGKDRHIVTTFNMSDPPYQVEVFGDDLYVTTYKQHLVYKLNKFFKKGDNLTLVSGQMMHIADIVIVQQYKQIIKNPNVTNVCSTNPCQKTQMCINNPSGPEGKRFSCICADGSKYNPTTKSCDFIMCQPDYCLNNGTCTNTQNNEFKCSCPMGFGGKRCEIDACLNYCGAGGTCLVGTNNPSTPTCHCPEGYSGKRCEIFNCAGFCQNRGICYPGNNGTPTCQCMKGFTGPRCQNYDPSASHCEGYCMNGGTCYFDKTGNRRCSCSDDYTGLRCESCGLQGSTVYCANGGTLICNNKNNINTQPRCQCLPGYDELSYCHNRTCKGYCLNDATCTLRDRQLSCQCKVGFTGDRCNTTVKECTNIACKNGGSCVQMNQIGHVVCQCPRGFVGSDCGLNVSANACQNFCKNGGNCSLANGNPICTCPEFYKGPQCQECRCGNNGNCVVNQNGQTYCSCKDLHFEGPFCNRSICHDWCYNSGTCKNCKINPDTSTGQCEECVCQPDTSGPRCHILLPRHSTTTEAQKSAIPIIIPVVIVICILLAVLLFIVIRKKRNGQFGHMRLLDHSKMQVANPVYMPQTTEENEEDESHQPLDQPFDFDPEKSTNFANPVYEQFYADSRQTLLPKREDSDDETNYPQKNGSV